MTNAVELLRKDFYRKGVCVIADIVKTRQEKTNNKRGIGNRGKTKIVVKEHFSEKGKTMEELLTDVNATIDIFLIDISFYSINYGILFILW